MLRPITFALLVLPSAAYAASQPIVVQQNSPRNVVRVIQQQSSVVNINRSVTVTQGDVTVTDIVAIGPDSAPVSIDQTGQINRAHAFQQAPSPILSLQQSGSVNQSWVVQREMP